MFKNFWAYITGDTVSGEVNTLSSGDEFKRFVYSPQMIEQINQGRRYQILANRSQTEIYLIDARYKQKVARFWDISYALIVADSLNQDASDE